MSQLSHTNVLGFFTLMPTQILWNHLLQMSHSTQFIFLHFRPGGTSAKHLLQSSCWSDCDCCCASSCCSIEQSYYPVVAPIISLAVQSSSRHHLAVFDNNYYYDYWRVPCRESPRQLMSIIIAFAPIISLLVLAPPRSTVGLSIIATTNLVVCPGHSVEHPTSSVSITSLALAQYLKLFLSVWQCRIH